MRSLDRIEVIQGCAYVVVESIVTRNLHRLESKRWIHAPQSCKPFDASFPLGVSRITGPSGSRGHLRKTKRVLPVWAISSVGALCRSSCAGRLESSAHEEFEAAGDPSFSAPFSVSVCLCRVFQFKCNTEIDRTIYTHSFSTCSGASSL